MYHQQCNQYLQYQCYNEGCYDENRQYQYGIAARNMANHGRRYQHTETDKLRLFESSGLIDLHTLHNFTWFRTSTY
jgi:hypothetical protein